MMATATAPADDLSRRGRFVERHSDVCGGMPGQPDGWFII
jgi:hypothetical protein